jgi:amino acid transporter
MAAFISIVAVAIVAIFFVYILKRLFSLLVRKKEVEIPLHERLTDVAEDVAAASKVAATLASAAAFFAAPAGLLAVAAAFGLAPKPLIVVLLPALLAFAGGAIALSALAKLYAKSMRKRKQSGSRSEA